MSSQRELETVVNRLTTHIAGLEYLIQSLFFTQFAKATDPAAATIRYAENLRERMEKIPIETDDQEAVLAIQEHLNSFFDRLIGQMRQQQKGQ